MRVNHKKNRQRAGKRNYQGYVAQVGEEYIRQMGAEYARRRTKESYANSGNRDKVKAAKAGKLGGSVSRRGRTFSLQTEMYQWEWMRLMQLANTAAGKLRLQGKIDAVAQTEMRSVTLQLYFERGHWNLAMTKAIAHPDWYNALGAEIESARQFYIAKLKEGEKLTEEEEEDFKIIRNLRSAWRVAKQS